MAARSRNRVSGLREALAEAHEVRMSRWHVPGGPAFVSPYRGVTADVVVAVHDALAVGIDVPTMHVVVLTAGEQVVLEPLRR